MRARNAAAGFVGQLEGPKGPLPAPITTRDQLRYATGKFCMQRLIFFINHLILVLQVPTSKL